MKRILLIILLSTGLLLSASLSSQAQITVGFGYNYHSTHWDYYGRWVWIPDYGDMWTPYVWEGWVPYYHGEWRWDPYYGWTWHSYEPWGWVTCHYGRWVWHPHYGWCWRPGRVWGPGWVAWIERPTYIYWVPLGYDDRPYYYTIPKVKNNNKYHKKIYKAPNKNKWIGVPKSDFGKKSSYKFADVEKDYKPNGKYDSKTYKPDKNGNKNTKENEYKLNWKQNQPEIKPDKSYNAKKNYNKKDYQYSDDFQKKTDQFNKTWEKKTGSKIDKMVPNKKTPSYGEVKNKKPYSGNYPYPAPKYSDYKSKENNEGKKKPNKPINEKEDTNKKKKKK